MRFYEDIAKVVNHIEDNIVDIQVDDISTIVGVPIGLYQRIFSYICGISIAEYIKKRRISLAAYDLLDREKNVIDIAMKYGYQSHASFSRAFKELMGASPSQITEEIIKLHEYPRFSFLDNDNTYQVVKGRRIMAELIRIEYELHEDRKIIGYQERTDFQHAGHMWHKFFSEGMSEKLNDIKSFETPMGIEYISLGFMRDFDDTGNEFEYTIGKYYSIDSKIPKDFNAIDIPAGIVAHARIKGKLNDILTDSYFLITDGLQKNGYRVDYENFYWCDVYTYEGYCTPIELGEEVVVLDYYMPCIKE